MKVLIGGIALVVGASALLAACGGGGQPEATPTPVATAAPSPVATTAPAVTSRPSVAEPSATAQGAPEEQYKKELQEVVQDAAQVYGVDWPQAFGVTPVFGQEWQEAMSGLAAKVEALSMRVAAMEPPDRFARSHALLDAATSKMADAVRKTRVAGATQDEAGLQEALADSQIGNALMDEALTQWHQELGTSAAPAAAVAACQEGMRSGIESIVSQHPAMEAIKTELQQLMEGMCVSAMTLMCEGGSDEEITAVAGDACLRLKTLGESLGVPYSAEACTEAISGAWLAERATIAAGCNQ